MNSSPANVQFVDNSIYTCCSIVDIYCGICSNAVVPMLIPGPKAQHVEQLF